MSGERIVIIYANGDGKRWRKRFSFPKQLADINGEPLLKRTIRQLHSRGFEEIYVATRDSQIIDAIKNDAIIFTPQDSSRWLAQTVQDTFPIWKGMIFGFWGDVCWEDRALDIYCSPPDEELLFHGRARLGEAFGFSVGPLHYQKFREAITKSIEIASRSGTYKYTMWAAYRIYHDMPPQRFGRDIIGWIEHEGWSMDIDTPEIHNKILLAMKGKYTW